MPFLSTDKESMFESLSIEEQEESLKLAHKAQVVLRWLLQGGVLDLHNSTYDGDTVRTMVRMLDGYLYCEVERHTYRDGVEVAAEPSMINIEMSLEQFIDECDKTDDAEIQAIANNNVLNDVKFKKKVYAR